MGGVYPEINNQSCINCGLCAKVCPNNSSVIFNTTRKVYVGWSLDTEIRRNSASGGIISSIYKYALDNNIQTFGVKWSREKGCFFVEIKNDQDIIQCRNSKYVYANVGDIYKTIQSTLKNDGNVIFVGLPCQVAGLKSFLRKDYNNLVCIDIICHGVAPAKYLEQHIESIELRKKRKSDYLYFRDPKYNTSTYTLTLGDNNGEFYRKPVLGMDNYQLGYHKMLIYRENCYSCKYAQPDRVGDLTVGDFSGLGMKSQFNGDRFNVSCILNNTPKGEYLLERIKERIYLEERPREEAFEYERQLKTPSKKHKKRKQFEDIYSLTNDFEKAASSALVRDKINAVFDKNKSLLKRFIRRMLPNELVSIIRRYGRR